MKRHSQNKKSISNCLFDKLKSWKSPKKLISIPERDASQANEIKVFFYRLTNRDRYEILPMSVFNPRLYSFICLKPIYPPTFSEESSTNSSMWEWTNELNQPSQITLSRSTGFHTAMREPAVHSLYVVQLRAGSCPPKLLLPVAALGHRHVETPLLDLISHLLWSDRLTVSPMPRIILHREGEGIGCSAVNRLKSISPASDLED